MGSWRIRPSTYFLLAAIAVVANLALPGGLEFIIALVSIPIFIHLRRTDRIKKFDKWDLILIVSYTVLMFVGLLYAQYITFDKVPWWKLVLVGVAADLVATLLGTIPVFGDFLSALVNFVIAFAIIGGFEGAMIAFALAIISMIPGPSVGMNTFMLVLLKIVAEFIL